MAGQRLLPNPARLTQHKQPPSHTNPPRPHKPSTLPCAHPNRTPNASAPKLPRMTRRLQKLFSVHLADQKEAAVAVAVLRGPSRPFVDKKKLQLPFSVALRVLCGQKVLPLPFFAVLRVPSWKKEVAVAAAVAVLRGPPCPPCPLWTKGVAVAVLRGPSWKKEVAVTVLRHPPRTKQNKRQHTQRLQKGLSRISRTGRISYNYNQ